MIFGVYNEQYRSILCFPKYQSIQLSPDFYQNTHFPTTDLRWHYYNKPNFQLYSGSFLDFILSIFLFPVYQLYTILIIFKKKLCNISYCLVGISLSYIVSSRQTWAKRSTFSQTKRIKINSGSEERIPVCQMPFYSGLKGHFSLEGFWRRSKDNSQIPADTSFWCCKPYVRNTDASSPSAPPSVHIKMGSSKRVPRREKDQLRAHSTQCSLTQWDHTTGYKGERMPTRRQG